MTNPPPVQLNYRTPSGYTGNPFWAERNLLLAYDRAILPPRCIKCNSDQNLKAKTQTIAWASPWLYLLLIFPGVLIGCIIILLVQKKVVLQYHTCAACRAKKLRVILITLALIVSAIVSIGLGINYENGVLILLGFFMFFGSLIYVLFAGRYFVPVSIQNNVVTLKGIHPDFLRNLPSPVEAPRY